MECATIDHANTLWIVIIQACYLLLPIRVAYHTRWDHVDRHKALAIYAIMMVFVFCGLAGYTTSLLPAGYWVLREYIHIALAVFSVALHVLGAPAILARSIER